MLKTFSIPLPFCLWKSTIGLWCGAALVNCSTGTFPVGALQNIQSRQISLNDINFRTCIFDPGYSIVHFPMYHSPPFGGYSEEDYETVVKSQFQLFHTVLDYIKSYRKVFLFDEHISSDAYNPAQFQALLAGGSALSYKNLRNQVFYLSNDFRDSQKFFPNDIPQYYEYLFPQQKDFLFHKGAGFLLYLLQKIPRIYKVISSENLDTVLGHPDYINNHYLVFDFRENEVKKEILSFYRNNTSPQNLFFISFGARHDFSDEFAGYPFQSGHGLCLKWQNSPDFRLTSILFLTSPLFLNRRP